MSYIQEAMLGTTPGDEPLVQQEDPPWTLTDKYWEDQWLISELEELGRKMCGASWDAAHIGDGDAIVFSQSGTTPIGDPQKFTEAFFSGDPDAIQD
jgi:hypothetical protein